MHRETIRKGGEEKSCSKTRDRPLKRWKQPRSKINKCDITHLKGFISCHQSNMGSTRQHQSSQALSAAPSLLMFVAVIMNLYLSSMLIEAAPNPNCLDKAIFASFCAAAASFSFRLATYKSRVQSQP